RGFLRRRRTLLFFFLALGSRLDFAFLARCRPFRLSIRVAVAVAADAADRGHALLVSVEAAIVAAVTIGSAPRGFLGNRRSGKQGNCDGQTEQRKDSHHVTPAS